MNLTSDEIKRAWYSKEVDTIISSKSSYVRSRYDLKDRLRLKNEDLIVRPLKWYDMIPMYSTSDTTHTITGNERWRPDILALKYYRDPRMYWVLLAANNMKSVLEFREGISIRIPSQDALYGRNGVMYR